MTLGARAVTFRMPADERPTSPGREAKSSRKSAAPRKAKAGKEKVSPAKKEEKPRAASPKTKKRSSRIQAIAIDPSPNMSLAVINRTAPQGPPEGFEEFDQQKWLEEQMELQRRFATMYSGNGGDEEDDGPGVVEDPEEEEPMEELAIEAVHLDRSSSPFTRTRSPPEWAQDRSSSASEGGGGEEESEPEPEFEDGPASSQPHASGRHASGSHISLVATGRDEAAPSPTLSESACDGLEDRLEAADICDPEDDAEAEATLRGLLAAAAAATAAAAPAPVPLSEDEHRRLKAKRRPPPRTLLADEGMDGIASSGGGGKDGIASSGGGGKDGIGNGGAAKGGALGASPVGASGLFERTGPITPRSKASSASGAGHSLAAEVAALSEGLVAAYSPRPGYSWS